jgi:pimeloyl-ACP methyl ester carboxylesterase
MSENVLEQFLAANTEERFRMALDAQTAPEIRSYFGEAAYADYAALAEDALRRLGPGNLGTQVPTNLIFVPGIMGSMLRSETLGGVWWIDALRGYDKLNKIGLAPDGLSDLDPNLKIVPFEVDTIYAPFLRACLLRDDFGHDVFPYDWRKAVSHNATRLRDKIARTFADNGGEKVHLVGHSMGGLVIRAALQAHGDELWPMLGRVIFLGTPHYGATLAVRQVKFHLWGPSPMNLFLAALIKPETLRSLWGAVGLIPAPRGIYPGTRPNDPAPVTMGEGEYDHPAVNFDLYDADAWRLGLSPEATANLQKILDHTRAHYERLHTHHGALDPALRQRMAVIAGVGLNTLYRLAYAPGFFGIGERMANHSGSGVDAHRGGDGTVPLASAQLENIGTIRYVAGVHAALPNLEAVSDDVFRWLNGEALVLPEKPGAALAGQLGGEGLENPYPHLTAPAEEYAASATGADFAEPPPEVLAEIEARIAAGDIPRELNLVRLF